MKKTILIILAGILLVFLISCGSDESTTDGDGMPDGDTTPDGDVISDGDADSSIDGDTDPDLESNEAEGDSTDGDVTDGDSTDGDVADGDMTDGDTVEEDSADGDVVDGDESDGDEDTNNGPTLEFVIIGDPDSEVTFEDAYAFQTPTDFFIGVQKVELMTSADDESPVTVFDAGENNYTEVDMQGETSLNKVDLFSLTSGTYTHAKVLLAMARFKVQAKVHPQSPLPAVDGPVSVLAALSDTTINSTEHVQDWVQYSFNFSGIQFDKVGVLPEFPDSATGDVIKSDGETWLLMELSEHMVINPSISDSYEATITMKTRECFRWEDESTSGYETYVFDSDQNGNSEPVMSFGPGEYSIVVE